MSAKTRVLGYVRVSTEEQATEGHSLAAQTDKIRAYCALYDLDLVDVIVDAGVSAKSLNRPGLQSVLGRLGKDVEGMVVVKLDRLSRSVADWSQLIDRYFGERAGRSLFSVSDSIDTRTAAGRLVLNVLMSVAQWERETTSERTRTGMQYLKATGKTTGQVPFGKRLSEDGVSLVDDHEEQGVIGEILDLRRAGVSYQEIADRLNHSGKTTKEGKPWGKTQVVRVVQRAS